MPVTAGIRGGQMIGTAVLVTTALVAAGCGGDDKKKVSLPSPGASSGVVSPQSGQPTNTPVSPEQAVRTAYIESYSTSQKSLLGPPEQVRPTMARSFAAPYLDLAVRRTLMHQEAKRIPWGSGVVVHIAKVSVTGDKATVEDCRDSSNAALQNKDTKKVEPGSRGTDRQRVVAQLTRGGDGQWRIYEFKGYRKPCSRPS